MLDTLEQRLQSPERWQHACRLIDRVLCTDFPIDIHEGITTVSTGCMYLGCGLFACIRTVYLQPGVS